MKTTGSVNINMDIQQYIEGTANTSFYLQKEINEVLVCNDGTGSINLDFVVNGVTLSPTILAGEQIPIPIVTKIVAPGLLVSIRTTTPFRLFVTGV